MRLINTRTFKLEEFVGAIPPYGILSHTWGADEVTFQAYSHRKVHYPQTDGYTKIFQTCRFAREECDLDYVWIDTCCIDKTSSAELGEAINSMFRWYKEASICFAYLSDMPAQHTECDNTGAQLSQCRWFDRGWTLQELLAPEKVVFLDMTWKERGTKATLGDTISQRTDIDPRVLQDNAEIQNRPVSVRMSWAATRKTTRIEDTAYCLFGIFDVHMPLVYGEGEKAFARLQHEIIKQDSDLSIFCWSPLGEAGYVSWPLPSMNLSQNTSPLNPQDHPGFYRFLAPTKEVFWGGGCTSYTPPHADSDGLRGTEFSLTHRGIKIRGGVLILCAGACPSQECICPSNNRKYFLPVQHNPNRPGSYRGVFLEKLSPDLFVRSSPHIIEPDEATSRHAKLKASRAIYIAVSPPTQPPRDLYLPSNRSKLFIPQSSLSLDSRSNYTIIAAAPQSRWHHCARGFFKDPSSVPQDQLWGLLNIQITLPVTASASSSKLNAFILLRYQNNELVHILHSERRDIVISMRDSSGWVWDDVQFLFREELALREGDVRRHVTRVLGPGGSGETLKVTAEIVNSSVEEEDGRLRVWVERAETASAARARGVL